MVIALGACRVVWVAKLGYATFDVQLQKAVFFVTSYTVRYMYVHVYAIAQYRCLRMSGPRDIDSRVTLSMLVI